MAGRPLLFPFLPPSCFLCVDWYAQMFFHQENQWAKSGHLCSLWVILVRISTARTVGWHYYLTWCADFNNRGRWHQKWLCTSCTRRPTRELLACLLVILVSWGLSHTVKNRKIGTLLKMKCLGKHVCFGVKQPWVQPLKICVILDLSLNLHRPQVFHLLGIVFYGVVLKMI